MYCDFVDNELHVSVANIYHIIGSASALFIRFVFHVTSSIDCANIDATIAVKLDGARCIKF